MYNNAVKHILTIYYMNTVNTFVLEDFKNEAIALGRSPNNDIVIDSPIVSAYHAKLYFRDGIGYIQDSNSRNGILINGVKHGTSILENGDIIRVDNETKPLKSGVVIIYSIIEDALEEIWLNVDIDKQSRINIGRQGEDDIVLSCDDTYENCATIFLSDDSYYIEDINTNGIYLNGEKVLNVQKIRINDVISIGKMKIIFNGKILFYNYFTKGFGIDAIGLKKEVQVRENLFLRAKRKKLLSNISITIKPGELVAIIGSSGAGKTTFIESLAGFKSLDEGKILINGVDLLKNYDMYKDELGYVPQNDAVYGSLTVIETLIYTSRILADFDTKSEKKLRDIIREVNIEGLEDVLIKDLSSGQRKRVSIATELLGEPRFLFLDEPTSGLDPEMEMNLGNLFKNLTKNNKTIVFTTHSSGCLGMCNKIVVLGNEGTLCFFGSPSDALSFFGVEDFPSIYPLVSDNVEYWEKTFERSKYYTYHKPLKSKKSKHVGNKLAQSNNLFRQLLVLTKRYLKLTFRDQVRMLFLLLQAPLIAILLGIITDSNSVLKAYEDTTQVILVLACSAVWLGLLNSIQEVSKEKNILARERQLRLNNISYAFSKIIVLGCFCIVQSFLLVQTYSIFITFPEGTLLGSLRLELIVTTFLASFVATLFGLLISTAMKSNDRAIVFIPVILVFQILFSGLMFKERFFAKVLFNISISNWATRAIGISLNLNDIPYKSPLVLKNYDNIYVYEFSNLIFCWMILILFSCIFAGLFIWANKRFKK